MQLISIGDAIINLERISVIDVDNENGVRRMKFHSESSHLLQTKKR